MNFGGRAICRLVYRMMLKEHAFCGILFMRKYCATAQKEIDYEKTDTDIIIRADVYRMRRDKQ